MANAAKLASGGEISIAAFAVCTRVAVLAWSALCAHLAPPYDTSGGLLEIDYPRTALDAWVAALLSHTANWDGAYFTEVARVGYTAEKQHAFFPGLPVVLQALRCAWSMAAHVCARRVCGGSSVLMHAY